MNAQLLLMNLPYNCSDLEVREWAEARGIQALSIRIIFDLVAGVSPAFGYVELKSQAAADDAVAALNGRKIRNHAITVERVPAGAAAVASGRGRF